MSRSGKEIIFSIKIKAHPKSKIKKAVLKNEKLEIYLNSAPEKNKANAELMKGLAGALKISKSSVTLTGGEKARNKKLEISVSVDQYASEKELIRAIVNNY